MGKFPPDSEGRRLWKPKPGFLQTPPRAPCPFAEFVPHPCTAVSHSRDDNHVLSPLSPPRGEVRAHDTTSTASWSFRSAEGSSGRPWQGGRWIPAQPLTGATCLCWWPPRSPSVPKKRLALEPSSRGPLLRELKGITLLPRRCPVPFLEPVTPLPVKTHE